MLDSVVEAAGPDPLYRDTFAATPRALRALCRSACRSFTRDPVADLERLVARLRRGPLRGRLVDEHGRSRRSSLTRTDVFGVLLAGDFDPALRAAFPGAVRSALGGDAASMLRLRRRAFRVDGEAPPAAPAQRGAVRGHHLRGDVVPVAQDQPARPGAAPAPGRRSRRRAPGVRLLPVRPRHGAAHRPAGALRRLARGAAGAPVLGPGPLPNVPVLLLEGEDDLRTPVEGARRVAALFPQARLVIAAATGHSALGSDPSVCARRAFDRFFRGGQVPSRCPKARRLFAPQPPAPTPAGPGDPLRGVRGVRGRTLATVGLTLRDVLEDAVTELIFAPDDPDLARGGGLRHGSYRIGGGGTLVLSGLAFVPGVRLTGRIRQLRRAAASAACCGSPASGPRRGCCASAGQRVRGRLGGRRVRARLTSLAATPAEAAAGRGRRGLLRRWRVGRVLRLGEVAVGCRAPVVLVVPA